MSDNRTRSGARLSSHQHGFTFRRLAQITAADYEQPKCKECGQPISDDRGYGIAQYCSRYCRDRRRQGHVGQTMTHGKPSGRETVWKIAYEQARAARGSEIEIACDNRKQAQTRAYSFNQRRDFSARSSGLIVYLRFVGAAWRAVPVAVP